MEAPPPVEIQLILSARPNLLTAATESPPPMMDVQSESATARQTASVPCSEVVELENAHGAVPEDGLGALDGLGVELLGLGADVHALAVIGDGVGGNDLGDGVLAKVIGDAVVDGEQNLDALGLGLLEHLARALDPVLLLEGQADAACP